MKKIIVIALALVLLVYLASVVLSRKEPTIRDINPQPNATPLVDFAGLCPPVDGSGSWYAEGTRDQKGNRCSNGKWSPPAVTNPVLPTRSSQELDGKNDKERVIHKPYTIYELGQPPLFNSKKTGLGQPMVLDPEVVAQFLSDMGVRKRWEIHIEWLGLKVLSQACQQEAAACANITPGIPIGYFRFLNDVTDGGPAFENNRDLTNAMIRLELGRMEYAQKGRRDLGGDGLGSEIFKRYYNRLSPYQFVK